MHFVVASAEQKWWGGCAWDSFGIMAALDREVLVATTCAGCRRPLAVLADPEAAPAEPYVARFLHPAARWWDDVVGPARPSGWPAARTTPRAGRGRPGDTVAARQGHGYGDRLHDDHRQRTPEEATAVFAELGLTGPFWDMAAPAAGVDDR